MDPSQTYRVCPMALLRFLVERTRSASMPVRRGTRRGRLLNPPRRTRTAVAMVLGQVQDAPVVGDLHVQGKAGLEAVFPADLEAEEVHVELPRLGFVENPKDRYR